MAHCFSPKIGPIRPCDCGCGRILYGMAFNARRSPICKRKAMNDQRKVQRAELKSQRVAERMRGPSTDPPRRKVRLCKECYGLARERGIDCVCLHPRAEAAE